MRILYPKLGASRFIKSLRGYHVKSAEGGSLAGEACKPGQTSAKTGCTPASGESKYKGKKEKTPKQKQSHGKWFEEKKAEYLALKDKPDELKAAHDLNMFVASKYPEVKQALENAFQQVSTTGKLDTPITITEPVMAPESVEKVPLEKKPETPITPEPEPEPVPEPTPETVPVAETPAEEPVVEETKEEVEKEQAPLAPSPVVAAKVAAVGGLPTNSLIDISKWAAHNTSAQWAAKKIKKYEELANAGDWDGLEKIKYVPKGSTSNSYTKAVQEAYNKLMEKKAAEANAAPISTANWTPAPAAPTKPTVDVSKLPKNVWEHPANKKAAGDMLELAKNGGAQAVLDYEINSSSLAQAGFKNEILEKLAEQGIVPVTATPSVKTTEPPKTPATPAEALKQALEAPEIDPVKLSETIKSGDPHEMEPTWKLPPNVNKKNVKYGAVVFNDEGKVLLREVANHYDNYFYTFAKGGMEEGDHPLDTANREVLEETGYKGDVIGFIPGIFSSGYSANAYFAMKANGPPAQKHDDETWGIQWVDFDEAKKLIEQTTNEKGKLRDLAILETAKKAWQDGLKDKKIKAKTTDTPASPKPVVTAPPTPLEAKPTNNVATGKWQKVGGQLGSNPGEQMIDPATGKKYYVKYGKGEDYAANEVLAAKLYQLAGSLTPEYSLADTSHGIGTASEWLDKSSFDPNNLAQKNKAAEDFAVHAWLGNWDAVGSSFDNQAVVGDKIATMDTGGAMLFHAKKDGMKEFGGVVKEWDNLRNSSVNENAAKVFGGMTNEQLVASAQKVINISDEAIQAMVGKFGPPGQKEKLMQALIARKNWIANWVANTNKAVATGTPVASVAATTNTTATTAKFDVSLLPPPPYSLFSDVKETLEGLLEIAKKGDVSALESYVNNTGSSKVENYKEHLIEATKQLLEKEKVSSSSSSSPVTGKPKNAQELIAKYPDLVEPYTHPSWSKDGFKIKLEPDSPIHHELVMMGWINPSATEIKVGAGYVKEIADILEKVGTGTAPVTGDTIPNTPEAVITKYPDIVKHWSSTGGKGIQVNAVAGTLLHDKLAEAGFTLKDGKFYAYGEFAEEIGKIIASTVGSGAAPAATSPTTSKPAPAGLPAKPKVVPAYAVKVDEIYNAAQAGDIIKLEAIVTNPSAASFYPKKVHEYKMAALAALKGGGTAPAIAPPAPAKKADISKLPVHDFETPQNVLEANTMYEFAKNGNIEALQAYTPSAMAGDNYKKTLINALKDQGIVSVAPASPKPLTVDPSKFPVKPYFIANTNKKKVDKLEQLAKEGNLKELKAAPALGLEQNEYKNGLIEVLKQQGFTEDTPVSGSAAANVSTPTTKTPIKIDVAKLPSYTLAPPFKPTSSKQWKNNAMSQIESLASAGNVAQLEAFQATPPPGELPSSTVDNYKNSWLSYLKNQSAVQQIQELAKKGDLLGLQAHAIPFPSTEIQAWKNSLVAEVNWQLNPPTSPKKFTGKLSDLKKTFKGMNEGMMKHANMIGYFLVTESPGLPDLASLGFPKIKYTATSSGYSYPLSDAAEQKRHSDAFAAMPKSLRDLVVLYTGPSDHFNVPLHKKNTLPDDVRELGEELQKYAPEFKPGTFVQRNINLDDTIKKKIEASVGSVLQETALSSSSIDGVAFHSADTHFHITTAPGARGLYVGGESGSTQMSGLPSEVEYILPAGSRFLITGTEKKNGKFVVHCIMLATTADQCC